MSAKWHSGEPVLRLGGDTVGNDPSTLPTAFLIDEAQPADDDSLGGYTDAVIEAVGRQQPHVAAVVRWGAMLTYTHTQRLAEVRKGVRSEPLAGSQSWTVLDDQDARFAICLHIHDYFAQAGAVRGEASWRAVAQNTVWVVAFHPLHTSVVSAAHSALVRKRRYLGVVPVDLGCPLLRDLLWDGLSPRQVVGPGATVRFIPEVGMDEYDQWTNPTLEDTGELCNRGWLGGDPEEIYNVGRLPRVALSAFGQRSVRLLETLMTPTRRELVAEALRRALDSDAVPEGFNYEVAAGVESDDDVEIAEAKLTRYLLNPEHPVGGEKARWLADALDLTPEDWQFFLHQLRQQLPRTLPRRVKVTDYGVTYTVDMEVVGRSGRSALLRTAWLAPPSGRPRFLTAFPAR